MVRVRLHISLYEMLRQILCMMACWMLPAVSRAQELVFSVYNSSSPHPKLPICTLLPLSQSCIADGRASGAPHQPMLTANGCRFLQSESLCTNTCASAHDGKCQDVFGECTYGTGERDDLCPTARHLDLN